MSEQGFTVRLSARVDGYLAAMESAKKATKDVGDSGVNLDRLGGKMQDVGLTMSKSVTLPLIAVGGVAIKMSSDFDSAFGRMVGLAGVTADEVDGLKKSVLDLAGKTAQSPQALADGLYFLRSSGLDAAKAMEALEVSARASAAGLGPTAVIADAVSSAMNAYTKSGLSAAEATDILTGTARAGKAEPAELAGALGRVLPIASELGVTFKDVGGAIASLSLTGNDASTSATLLTNILSKMLKPSQQGAEALAGVGMSATSIRESIAEKGLLGTLDDLKARLGDAGFVKFLEDAQAVQGALSLTGQNAEQVHTVFDQVAASAGATDEAFAAISDTAGFKMKQAWADVQVALIKAGDIIMPIAAGIAGAIAKVAGVFSELPGPVQKIVVGFLALVAAAGPLLIVAGTIVKNYKEVKLAMDAAAAGASTAALALGAVGLVMLAATAWYSDNARKKAELVAITNTFVDALKAEADGQQGAVDAAIAASLSTPKLIEQARVLGLSVSDMAKIVKGEAVPAYEHWQQMAHDDTWTQLGSQMNDVVYAFGTVNDALAPLNDGLANAKVQTKAMADVSAELGVNTARTADQIATQTANFNKQLGIVDEVAMSAADVAAATDAATAATALYQAAADSMAADIKRSLDEIQGKWDQLTGKINDDESLTNLQGDFDNVKQKAVDAWKAASEGADDSAAKTRTAHLATDELKKSVIDYGKEILGLPPEKVTKMLAQIDAGNLDYVEAQLAAMARNRTMQLDIQLKGGSGSFSIVPGTRSASGRYAAGGSNIYSSLGEVPGPTGDEVVLPIGNQAALTGWLADPRVGAPIAAAMGGWSAPVRSSSTVNNYNAQVNNNNQPVTVDVVSRALAMARLAA